MKEADMAPIVANWLRGHGYTVYAEVPYYFHFRHLDLVGMNRTGDLRIVELKTGFSPSLLRQCQRAKAVSEDVWAAVSREPRNVLEFQENDIGLLWVLPRQYRQYIGDIALASPCMGRSPHSLINAREAANVKRALSHMTPSDAAGRPNSKGQGPAQDVNRAVALYLIEHPEAKWPQIFKAIPNHYKDARSMAGAMRMVKLRTAKHGGPT